MLKRSTLFPVLCATLLLSANPLASLASEIRLTGNGAIKAPGDNVSVTFSISGLSAASGDSLRAYDLNILFDPNALHYNAAIFLDPKTGKNELEFPEVTMFPYEGVTKQTAANTLDSFAVSGNSQAVLDALQSNSFSFLTLQFSSINGLATSVSLNLANPNISFVSSGNQILSPRFIDPTIAFNANGPVSPVPEPATFSLVLLGIAALLTPSIVRGRRSPNL